MESDLWEGKDVVLEIYKRLKADGLSDELTMALIEDQKKLEAYFTACETLSE